MALDAQPLAHASGGGFLIARALLFASALAATAVAGALDIRPEAYRDNARRGAVGAVTGRALTEGPRPTAPEQPVTGVGVTLVPRSDALLTRLEEIRDRARGDLDAYRTSAGALVGARRAYERALSEAGVADLVRFTAVDPEGRFDLEGVAAGAWLLIAQRAVYVSKESPQLSRRQRQLFERQPRLTGYYVVTVWLREVTVSPGSSEVVELTDRNVWMTAIQEERVLDASP